MDIKDRIAVVTGAGSGIGRETAIELARHGCTVALVGRRENKLIDTLAEVHKYAPPSIAEICDVSDQAQVEQMVQKTYEYYKHIDILVNNAGMMTVKLFHELSEDEFNRHMSINYYGAVYFTRAVLPIMEKQGRGVIMNVASVNGKLCVPGTTGYAASKAALHAFSEALYYELKDKGIHVGVVLPGGTRTEIHNNVSNKLGQYQRDHCTTPPSKPAKSIRRAIEEERFETVTPSSYKFYIRFHSLLPGVFRALVLRTLRPYFY